MLDPPGARFQALGMLFDGGESAICCHTRNGRFLVVFFCAPREPILIISMALLACCISAASCQLA